MNNRIIENKFDIDILQIIKYFGPKISSLSHRMILNKEVAKEIVNRLNPKLRDELQERMPQPKTQAL